MANSLLIVSIAVALSFVQAAIHFGWNPLYAQAYEIRGYSFSQLGCHQKAIDDWQRSIQLNPKTPEGILSSCADPSIDLDHPQTPVFCFVDPADAYARDSLPKEKSLDRWSTPHKKAILAILRKIQKKAPGFVARAGHGQPIRFVTDKHNDNNLEMSTNRLRVKCYPVSLRLSSAILEWDLIHELVHAADCNFCLANGQEWQHIVVPRMLAYRAKNRSLRPSGSINPYLTRLGLPTSYASENTAEALAEYTAAMVAADWEPPIAIKNFINRRLLSEPPPRNI